MSVEALVFLAFFTVLFLQALSVNRLERENKNLDKLCNDLIHLHSELRQEVENLKRERS